MNKLNDLYYKNTAQQTKMTNDNFNIENEFKQKLKELENESIKLESQISTLKEEKADILAEIVEADPLSDAMIHPQSKCVTPPQAYPLGSLLAPPPLLLSPRRGSSTC